MLSSSTSLALRITAGWIDRVGWDEHLDPLRIGRQ